MAIWWWPQGIRLRRRYRPITGAEWALIAGQMREREQVIPMFVEFGLVIVPPDNDLQSVRIRQSLASHCPDSFAMPEAQLLTGLPPIPELVTLAPVLVAAGTLRQPLGDTAEAERRRRFLRVERGQRPEG